ncbi:hypothetical protein D5086_027458 [Populus alba]|uniref:Uncharacterized protein n=1 Tax=Populus alba TaxID=43335 RepID=A0ACC4AVD9_POPAL
MSISSGGGGGFGSGSGFGLTSDVDSFSSKPKGLFLHFWPTIDIASDLITSRLDLSGRCRQPSSATAPPKGLGMKLGKTQRANQFLESLKAEGEMIGIYHFKFLTKKTDSSKFRLKTGGIQVSFFKTHPNVNKELFANENILGLRDPSRPFPACQTGDAGVGLLKWRMQSVDESMVPLTINCWPSESGNETYVSIEYEASSMFDLRNVVIAVPLPALREAPNVRQIDGEWKYDARNSILEWSILLIDNSNRSGSMEFVVPSGDSSHSSPLLVQFFSH